MNKFSLLLYVFLATSSAFSQTETNTNFATQMNIMFGQLNKTKVPNGILLDFGMEFTNLRAFNSTLTCSKFTTF